MNISSTTSVGASARTSAAMPHDKSGAAPGQLAKAAVAAARDAGIELPRNAQGLAASQIARGADPASVFAALVADGATGEDAGDTPNDPGTDSGVEPPVIADGSGAADVDAILTAAKTALELLES